MRLSFKNNKHVSQKNIFVYKFDQLFCWIFRSVVVSIEESLDETVRQNQQEKLQLESLCREQEHVFYDRQMKMATLIQAWYRGKR